MRVFAAATAIAVTFVPTALLAQTPTHPSCTAAATSRLGAGIYLLSSTGEPLPVNGAELPYEPSARFMFIADRELASKNLPRVLVIKARTIAKGNAIATRVQLRRARIVNDCGRRTHVPFAEANAFVYLNDYAGHLGGQRTAGIEMINEYFHFETRDSEVGGGQCIATNRLHTTAEVFGFPDTGRHQVVAERYGASFAEPGKAKNLIPAPTEGGRRYAGIKSEMQVVFNGASRCIVFQAPLPSYEGPPWADFYIWGGRPGWAQHVEAAKWEPVETRVDIVGLGGSKLRSFSLRWKTAP